MKPLPLTGALFSFISPAGERERERERERGIVLKKTLVKERIKERMLI